MKLITDQPGEKQADDPDVVATAVVAPPSGTTLVGGNAGLADQLESDSSRVTTRSRPAFVKLASIRLWLRAYECTP